MKNIYLILAIAGTVIPFVFFGDFIVSEGINLSLFLALLFSNNPSSGIAADLLISSVVFWVFIVQQAKSSGTAPHVYIILNLFIGLSCALPLYLYMQERCREGDKL